MPFPSPGDLPDPGIEPGSPALQAGFGPSEPPGKTVASVSHLLLDDKYYEMKGSASKHLLAASIYYAQILGEVEPQSLQVL